MITPRPSDARGHFDFGWLDTFHTFSFGDYHDRDHMGFRSLRVINEDVVAPGQGFGTHPHRDMEIITWVLSGRLAHRDSLGHTRELLPGEVQRMSAGTGIMHSEFNPSDSEPVHLLQIWIRPDRPGHAPAYDQTPIPAASLDAHLALLASPDGRDGSLRINQDARLYATRLARGRAVELPLAPGRHAWVQVAKGALTLNGTALAQGDGAAVSGEAALRLTAVDDAEALVFDLA